jgi:hypothetical protein
MVTGVCPVLFGKNMVQLREILASEPTRLHTDLQQLAKRFINPELVGLEEGGHIVKSPRERDCPLPFRSKKVKVTTSSKMNRNEIEEEQGICLALLNHSQRYFP